MAAQGVWKHELWLGVSQNATYSTLFRCSAGAGAAGALLFGVRGHVYHEGRLASAWQRRGCGAAFAFCTSSERCIAPQKRPVLPRSSGCS